jgi:hypothetical protein
MDAIVAGGNLADQVEDRPGDAMRGAGPAGLAGFAVLALSAGDRSLPTS